MNLVKRSFANIIGVINITFPCFLYPNGLCATIHLSWLNFSSKITLYHTLSQTASNFLLQLFQLYPHSFLHTFNPHSWQNIFFNIFYSQHNQVTHCRPTFWHLVIYRSMPEGLILSQTRTFRLPFWNMALYMPVSHASGHSSAPNDQVRVWNCVPSGEFTLLEKENIVKLSLYFQKSSVLQYLILVDYDSNAFNPVQD